MTSICSAPGRRASIPPKQAPDRRRLQQRCAHDDALFATYINETEGDKPVWLDREIARIRFENGAKKPVREIVVGVGARSLVRQLGTDNNSANRSEKDD